MACSLGQPSELPKQCEAGAGSVHASFAGKTCAPAPRQLEARDTIDPKRLRRFYDLHDPSGMRVDRQNPVRGEQETIARHLWHVAEGIVRQDK